MSSPTKPRNPYTVLPRSFFRLRPKTKTSVTKLPAVPTSNSIDRTNTRQHEPPVDHQGNQFDEWQAPSRNDTAAHMRQLHGKVVADQLDAHDTKFLGELGADGDVMRAFDGHSHSNRLYKRTQALEDSYWKDLVRARLDKYARGMLPQAGLDDGTFQAHYDLSARRVAKLEDYVAETDYFLLIARLDRQISELDTQLQHQTPEGEERAAQIKQLGQELELDKLLLLRHRFSEQIQEDSKSLSTARGHPHTLSDDLVKHTYKTLMYQVAHEKPPVHNLVEKSGLRSQPSQARYYALFLTYHLNEQYRATYGSRIPSNAVQRQHRILVHLVNVEATANPPRDTNQAHQLLEKCRQQVSKMPPAEVEAKYRGLRRVHSLLRPASMHGALPADEVRGRTDTDTEDEESTPSGLRTSHSSVHDVSTGGSLWARRHGRNPPPMPPPPFSLQE